MSFFCIQCSRLLLLLFFCSLNKESKSLLSNVYFEKFSKENVLKWKFWNCYLLRSFIAHPTIFLWSKLNFLFEKTTTIWTKKSFNMIFCNFLNTVHTHLPNVRQLQYVTHTFQNSQTNRTNRLLCNNSFTMFLTFSVFKKKCPKFGENYEKCTSLPPMKGLSKISIRGSTGKQLAVQKSVKLTL